MAQTPRLGNWALDMADSVPNPCLAERKLGKVGMPLDLLLSS